MSLRIYARKQQATPPPPQDPFFTLGSEETPKAPPVDGYLASLSKLVPAEVATAYLVLVGLLPAAPKVGGAVAMWIVVGILVVLTPLYVLYRSKEPTKPLVLGQAFVTLVIFLVWAYIIGGPFTTTPGYDKFWGSLALVVISASSPLLVRYFPANQA
jgi:hypothetical protein